jgi:hypothetical protein
MKYVDHSRKEDIAQGNLFLLIFVFYFLFFIFFILEEQPFFILENLIMKRYKHSKKLLLNHVSNFIHN